VPTVTLTVTLSGPDAQESADRLVQAISEVEHTAAVSGSPSVLIDTVSRKVVLGGGEALRFTRREYDLLLFLACHPGAAFTRLQLLRAVWGHEFSGERTVDVHVRRIRMKLGAVGDSISTVHGFGYRLENAHEFSVVRQSF
jgi:two-component system OmpR family response regulator